MYGPDISFILGDYNSREGGTGREFFALIPFAANVSKLSVSVNIVEIDANTDINITLEESLDGENWALAELLTASPITATAFKVLHTTKDFGAMARLRIKVEANTGSIAVNSRLEGSSSEVYTRGDTVRIIVTEASLDTTLETSVAPLSAARTLRTRRPEGAIR